MTENTVTVKYESLPSSETLVHFKKTKSQKAVRRGDEYKLHTDHAWAIDRSPVG